MLMNGLASARKRAGTEVCSPPGAKGTGEDAVSVLWQCLTQIHELPS